MITVNLTKLIFNIIQNQKDLNSFISSFYNDFSYLIEKSYIYSDDEDNEKIFFEEHELKKKEIVIWLRKNGIQINKKDKYFIKKILLQNKVIVRNFIKEKIQETAERIKDIKNFYTSSKDTFEINNKWDEKVLKYLIQYKTGITDNHLLINYKGFLHYITVPLNLNFFEDNLSLNIYSLILYFYQTEKLKTDKETYEYIKENLNKPKTNNSLLDRFSVQIKTDLYDDNINIYYKISVFASYQMFNYNMFAFEQIKKINSKSDIKTIFETEKKFYSKNDIKEEYMKILTENTISYANRIRTVYKNIFEEKFWKNKRYSKEHKYITIQKILKNNFFSLIDKKNLIKEIKNAGSFLYFFYNNGDFTGLDFIEEKFMILDKISNYFNIFKEQKINNFFIKIKKILECSYYKDKLYFQNYSLSPSPYEKIFWNLRCQIKCYKDDIDNLYGQFIDKIKKSEKTEFDDIIYNYLNNKIYIENIPEKIFKWKKETVFKFLDYFNYILFKEYIYSDKTYIGKKHYDDILTDALCVKGNFFIPNLFTIFLLKEKYNEIEEYKDIFDINPFLLNETEKKEKKITVLFQKIVKKEKLQEKIKKEIKKSLTFSDKGDSFEYLNKKFEKPYIKTIDNPFKEKAVFFLSSKYLTKLVK